MKVYKLGDFDVARIDFCCGTMAQDILSGVVKTGPWTDHPLYFEVGDYPLSHCGHCGAKIEGGLIYYDDSPQEVQKAPTAEAINEAGLQWLYDNQSVSVPYSMTVGYWECMIINLSRWGFKIVEK